MVSVKHKLTQLMIVIGIDKIATSHFLLKAIANRTLQNYVLASSITYNAGEWTKYVTSAFPSQNNK